VLCAFVFVCCVCVVMGLSYSRTLYLVVALVSVSGAPGSQCVLWAVVVAVVGLL
jgi:hypothetical protein